MMSNKVSKKKSILVKFLSFIIVIWLLSMLFVGIISGMTVYNAQYTQMESFVKNTADEILTRLEDNAKVSFTAKEALNNEGINKARAVAYMITENPDDLSYERFIKIKESLGVDEVHLCDEKGVLMWGTEEGFYGFDFNTDEQTKPFLRALTDKNFEFAQDPTPRGVDNVIFQYIGVARQDKPGIVQIGYSPRDLEKVLNLTSIETLAASLKFGKTGFCFVVDEQGNILYHPDSQYTGKYIKDISWENLLGSNKKSGIYKLDGISYYADSIYYAGKYAILAIEKNEYMDVFTSYLISLIAVVLISLVIAMIIITILIRKNIITKIHGIEDVLNHTAIGDFKTKSGITGEDELGQMSQRLNEAITNVAGLVTSVQNETSTVDIIATDLVSSIKTAVKSVDEISSAINEMANGATEQADASKSALDMLHDLADSLESIAGIANEIKEYSFGMDSATKVGAENVKNLKQGMASNENISHTVMKNIQDLSIKSSVISEITETIKSIAEQTNMLALNASIEAARAGESGKSFAVVANEIKKLSSNTNSSAAEIETIIKEIQKSVGLTKSNMDETTSIIKNNHSLTENVSSSFKNILSAVEVTSGGVEKMAGLIGNLNRNKNTVVEAVEEISKISQDSAAISEEIAASTQLQLDNQNNMEETANRLKQSSIALKKSISSFRV